MGDTKSIDKDYVLDTSVLLHDPDSLYSFQEHNIHILPVVIAELDRFKNGNEVINANAREVSRRLEKIMKEGDPFQGIPLSEKGKRPGLGKLFFSLSKTQGLSALQEEMEKPYADPVLIVYAASLAKQERKAILVSKDTNLRICARLQGVEADDYRHDKAQLDLHSFMEQKLEHEVPSELINRLNESGKVPVPSDLEAVLQPSQYLVLKQGSHSTLAKYREGHLVKLRKIENVEDIKPRNKSQRFLLDACLDPEIKIVSALGMAGTGKTLLSLVAGLHQVINKGEQQYHKVVVFRPTLETGKELGYLPGEVKDKINPHFQSIYTALEIIFGREGADYPQQEDWVEYRPINYIRGDTLPHKYILVDEAQNFTFKELKLIGTRMGEGSKIVVAGDPFQIDHPYLDERSAGLMVMTEKLRGKVPEFAYVILDKVERSPEAEIFAKYL